MYQQTRRNSNNTNSQEQESSNQFTYGQSTFTVPPKAKKAEQPKNAPAIETSTAASEIVPGASSTVIQQQETVELSDTEQINLPENSTLVTQSQGDGKKKRKNRKKKSKIKRVEQKDPGASIQAPVEERDQNPPQTTTAALPTAQVEQQQAEQSPPQTTTEALSIVKQKIQEFEQQSDILLEKYNSTLQTQLTPLFQSIYEQKRLELQRMMKEVSNSQKELEKLEKKIQENNEVISLFKKRVNQPNFQKADEVTSNRIRERLEENLTVSKDLETIFFEKHRFVVNIINQQNLQKESEESLIKTTEYLMDGFKKLFLPKEVKEEKNRLKSNTKFAISKLNNSCQTLSSLLENPIIKSSNNEETIRKNSNEAETVIATYKKWKDTIIEKQKNLIGQAKEVEKFIIYYNDLVSSYINTEHTHNQIRKQSDSYNTTALKQQEENEIFERSKYLRSQIYLKIKQRNEVEKIIPELISYCQDLIVIVTESSTRFNNLFNDFQKEFTQILSSLKDKKTSFNEDDSFSVDQETSFNEDDSFSVDQEDSDLVEENPENILSKIETLYIDSPESGQPFQVVGKSKKGKTISGTASQRSIPVVRYKEGKWQESGEYEVDDIGFFRIAQNAKLVRVEFDPQMKMEKREQLYAQPSFKLNQTTYRFDLLNSGNRDYAWAIETDKDDLSTMIHPFDEAVAYTRQALLTTPLAVNTGSKIKGTAVKDKTPFTLKNGIELMVSDGFGFIKASLADSLISKIQSQRQSVSNPSLKRSALPNTQMLQWLPQDNKLIFELVENGINSINKSRGIKQLLQKSASTARELPKNAASVPDMQIEKLYRAVTTGNFAVRVGTAMPVPGEQVVLPPSILPNHTEVALHRSPADTMNWTTGSVASEDLCSEYIGNMYGLQYRWAGNELGHQSEPFVFYKGVLGRIPDEEWDSKFPGDIVVCTEDRKVDKGWKKAADIDRAKQTETQFMIEGDLAVSKLLDPGSLIGVPPQMMKNLSGDYDGDEVHILAKSDSPVLFHQIQLQEPKKIPNPKLEKDRRFPQLSISSPATQNILALVNNRFAIPEKQTKTLENPAARSLSERLLDITIGNHLIGIWATVADLLSTVHPRRLESKFLQKIGELIIQKPLQNQQELWQYIGLGIKAGTDLAKTNLEGTEFLGRKLTAKQLLEEGKRLNNFLVKQEKLRSPHKRRNIKSIVDDITQGKRLSVIYNEEQGKLNVRSGHYGNLFEIMYAMDLYLETSRSGQNFTSKGEVAPTQLEQATEAIERARKTEITNQDVFILKVYEILGKLKQILHSNYKENQYARENGTHWMLLVIKELQPAKLRQELYAQSSPTSVADLQSRYNNLLNQIQKLWHQFTSSNETTEGDGHNMPSYRWIYDDNDPRIMAGINYLVIYRGIIQNSDMSGGRNVDFRLNNSVNLYHIHFNGMEGKRVNAIRFKSDSNQEGDNIVEFVDNQKENHAPRKTLKFLFEWCQKNGYPNHSLLLSRLLNTMTRSSSFANNSYKAISIKPDGNCFFHAVAEGLSRQFDIKNNDHCTLRQRAVDYMRNHQAEFAPMYLTDKDIERLRNNTNNMVKEQFKDVHTYDEYVKKMEKDGTWGGDTEAAALSSVLNKSIILHHSNQVEFVPDAINLEHVGGNHFNFLLPVSAQAASSSTASRVVESYSEQGT